MNSATAKLVEAPSRRRARAPVAIFGRLFVVRARRRADRRPRFLKRLYEVDERLAHLVVVDLAYDLRKLIAELRPFAREGLVIRVR